MTRRDLLSNALKSLCALPLLGVRGVDASEYVRIEGPKPGLAPISNECDPQFGMFNRTRVAIEFQGHVVPPHSQLLVPRHKIQGFRGMNHVVWSESENDPAYGWVKNTAHSDRGKA